VGFGIVALVVATGYAVGRIGILGENALEVLTKAAFSFLPLHFCLLSWATRTSISCFPTCSRFPHLQREERWCFLWSWRKCSGSATSVS